MKEEEEKKEPKCPFCGRICKMHTVHFYHRGVLRWDTPDDYEIVADCPEHGFVDPITTDKEERERENVRT